MNFTLNESIHAARYLMNNDHLENLMSLYFNYRLGKITSQKPSAGSST